MTASEFFQLFQARALLVVVDNPEISTSIQKLGFKNTALASEFDFIHNTKPLLWLISDYESQYKMASLWDEAGGIIVQMTESKAGGTTNTLLYTLEKLLTTDYDKLLSEREAAYEKLLTYNQINIHTPDALLCCHIGEEVEVANNESELESGYLYSLAEFFKASLINMDAPTSTFRLEGKLAFEGFLHQANTHTLRQEVLAVMQHFQTLFQQGGNYLYFENNRITRLIMGDTDVSSELLSLCQNKEWETNATEFALALLNFSADWNLNTLFHQTLAGVHVGMGMGEKIPFLDFSAHNARLDFPA